MTPSFSWLNSLCIIPRASGQPLDIARADRRAVAHRILVSQRPVEHVTDDLHVAVTVGAEALSRLHAVLVDDAQRAPSHVPRVV